MLFVPFRGESSWVKEEEGQQTMTAATRTPNRSTRETQEERVPPFPCKGGGNEESDAKSRLFPAKPWEIRPKTREREREKEEMNILVARREKKRIKKCVHALLGSSFLKSFS
jgi:hypothetical protein